MDHWRQYLATLFETYGAQSKLARDSGVHQTTLSSWVGGRSDTGKPSLPNAEQIVAVARALNISVDFFLTGREFWPEMNDERLKRLVLRLRWLDERTLSALEAAVDTLVAKSEPELSGSASGETEEDQAESPSQG